MSDCQALVSSYRSSNAVSRFPLLKCETNEPITANGILPLPAGHPIQQGLKPTLGLAVCCCRDKHAEAIGNLVAEVTIEDNIPSLELSMPIERDTTRLSSRNLRRSHHNEISCVPDMEGCLDDTESESTGTDTTLVLEDQVDI